MDFKFEDVTLKSQASNCFPDFFDDCNPTIDACIPSDMDDGDGEN